MQSIHGLVDSLIDSVIGAATYIIVDALEVVFTSLGYSWWLLIIKILTFLGVFSFIDKFERSNIFYFTGYFLGFIIMSRILGLSIIDVVAIVVLFLYVFVKILEKKGRC